MKSRLQAKLRLLTKWLRDREIILGYPGEPGVITSLLSVKDSGKRGGQSDKM